jgi:5'-nucleotidase / UDP-sugar diphosphatase
MRFQKLRKILTASGISLVALSLTAVSSCELLDSKDGVELTILHTNDLHSHFRPVQGDPFGLGGFARLSTLMQKLRSTAKHSITVDAGDWSEGTWFYNIDVGANTLRLLDMMKYNAVVLGNHDYLAGPDQILRRMETSPNTLPVLAANLDYSAYPQADQLSNLLHPYRIIDVDGMKVGIIGVTTFEFVFNDYILPVVITNPMDAASRWANELRPQVDVLILLSHNNFDYNKQLARTIPGIDAVISGHKHLKLTKAELVQNNGRQIPVVEAGDWGRYLGELKLVIKPNRFVEFKSFNLHPVTPDIAEDPIVAATVAQQVQALNEHSHDDIDRAICHSDVDIHKKNGTQSLMGQLNARAYRMTANADLGLEQAFFVGPDINAGSLSLENIHDLSPHIYDMRTGREWTVKIWNSKGLDLWLLLNFFYSINGTGAMFGWLSVDGADITWDPGLKTKDIPAISNIKINGVSLDPEARYRVALNDGIWTILTKVVEKTGLPLDLSQLEDTNIEGSRSVIQFAEQAGNLTADVILPSQNLHTTGPDLGVASWNMKWNGVTLSMVVENFSVQDYSSGAKLVCSTGLPNDILAFRTESQKWTTFYDNSISPIPAQSKMTVEVSLNQIQFEPGFFPVQCEVRWDRDVYLSNNIADKIFNVPTTTAKRLNSKPQLHKSRHALRDLPKERSTSVKVPGPGPLSIE